MKNILKTIVVKMYGKLEATTEQGMIQALVVSFSGKLVKSALNKVAAEGNQEEVFRKRR